MQAKLSHSKFDLMKIYEIKPYFKLSNMLYFKKSAFVEKLENTKQITYKFTSDHDIIYMIYIYISRPKIAK